jgi:hypothetical protein
MIYLDIDFVAYESRVIHFDRPDATVALFSEKSIGRASEMVLFFCVNKRINSCFLFSFVVDDNNNNDNFHIIYSR